MPTVKSALVCILAYCMGIIVGAGISFISMKFSTCFVPKMIIESNDLKSNPVKYAFVAGSLIGSLALSILLFVFSSMLYFSRSNTILYI